MAKADGTAAPLRFRGTPLLVEGLTPFRYADIMHGASVTVMLGGDGYQNSPPTNIQTVPAGETATWVRFSLSLTTPAGTYPGEVRLADATYPIVVDLEGKAALHLSPRNLTLTSRAGANITVDLTAANTGNAPGLIPETGRFGLFPAQALERSIAEAVSAPAAEGRARVDTLMNKMADEHGGFVRLKVAEGAGPLGPGEFRNLKVKLRLPDALKRGQSYSGSWMIEKFRFRIWVDVSAQAGDDTGKGNGKEAE